jgi:hypothetical protein
MSESLITLVKRIDVRLKTSARTNAGTTGPVFLAIGGREFRLGAPATGSDKVFTLGEGANISNPTNNDPRTPLPVTIGDVIQNPSWIRLSGADDWDLELLSVTVYSESRQLKFEALTGADDHLWLGPDTGGSFIFLNWPPRILPD